MLDSFPQRTNWWMILLLFFVITISPIMALAFSVMFYRQKISYIFLIIFAFYFGWFYAPQLDLLNHYNHFCSLIGKSLSECWKDSKTTGLGKEVYPVLFKYTVGKISSSSNFFSACAMTVYTCTFCVFLANIRPFYGDRINPLKLILFLGVIFTVEYYWFLGFRFWTGAFVWCTFFLKYIFAKKLKFIFLSATAILFHFSLAILPIILLADYLMKRNNRLRVALVISSFVAKMLQFDLFTVVSKLTFLKGYIKDSSFNVDIIKSVKERIEMFRTEGNQFYMVRNDVLFLGLVITFYLLYKKDKEVAYFNKSFFNFLITFYAVVNFCYADMILYDRMYKLLILLFFVYLLIYIHSRGEFILSKRRNFNYSLPLAFSVLYSVLTIIISQREYLWKIELWFNSFLFQ